MHTICDISFSNNADKVFFSGEPLAGQIDLKFVKEKLVRGIYINIIGMAYSQWFKGIGDNKKIFEGKEVYFTKQIYLIGDANAKYIQAIPSGSYKYVFECELPEELPTSFEGEFGYIRYTLYVNLDRPMWPDQTFEEAFTVIKPLHLNADITLQKSVELTESRRFYIFGLCCCYCSDLLTISTRLPKSGYAPGEAITLLFNTNNKSSQEVTGFVVQFVLDITYYISPNSNIQKNEKTIIFEKGIKTQCKPSEQIMNRMEIIIPAVPPTDTTSSNILKVKYFVKVKATVSCFHHDPQLCIPVVIGTHPINNSESNSYCEDMKNCHSGSKINPFKYVPFGKPCKIAGKNFAPRYPIYGSS